VSVCCRRGRLRLCGALIAGLAGSVVSLDSDEKLTGLAQGNFARSASPTPRRDRPAGVGRPAEAPFDLILVDGSARGISIRY